MEKRSDRHPAARGRRRHGGGVRLDRPFSRDARATRSIPAQALAHEVFDPLGVVPTYVIDHPVATDPQAVAFLRGLQADGRAEIGAHLHPWVSPPHDDDLVVAHVAGDDGAVGNLLKWNTTAEVEAL